MDTMTLYEALRANPLFAEFDKEKLLPFFIKRGIAPESVFSQEKAKTLELLSADLYAQMSLLPDFSEGSLSVSYNREQLLKRAKALYKKHNEPAGAYLAQKPPMVKEALLW